jgi:transposase InsO family protein
MAWNTTSKEDQRYALVREMEVRTVSLARVCQRHGISRTTAYRWQRRFRPGRLEAMKDRSHRPTHIGLRTSDVWLDRLRRLRGRRPTWGARKLYYQLAKTHGRRGVPAVATLSRWLKLWGLARGPRRRKSGPVVMRRRVRPARRCNETWTVDFKGWYRTGNGVRVDPLTVRDLHSRYVLGITLLVDQSVVRAERAFRSLFRKHGIPERIRCDNGSPFGGAGPTGLTRLSAWWVKLGIGMEFMTPGRPCENGGHEQFHRVYKKEVARFPAWTMRGQQRRSTRWLKDYNENRPHEGVKMVVPAQHYCRNARRLPARVAPWSYPSGWERRWVRGNGEINWQGKRRYVGEAFVRDYVGLQPVRAGVWRVHFGTVLVGELWEKEIGSIRLARYRHRKRVS